MPALTLQESAQVKAILLTLLREVSADQPTMQVFAELTNCLGFVGAEVDKLRAVWQKSHSEEMALALSRQSMALGCTIIIINSANAITILHT